MWLFNGSLLGEPPHCLPDWLYQFAFPPAGWEGSPLSRTLSAGNFIRGNKNSVRYTQGQESSCRIHPKAPDTKPLEATTPLSKRIPRLSFWLHHQRSDRENVRAPQNIEIIHLVKLESRAQLLNRKRPLWIISNFPSTLILTLLMKKLINDETSPLSNDITQVCIRWNKAT